MANAGTVTVELDASSIRLLRELKKAQNATRRTAKGMRNDFQASFGKIRNAANSLQGALAVVFAGRFVKGIVDAGIQMERFERAMKVATGSSELAAKEMAFVQKSAMELGLDLETTAGSYGKLIAAARGTTLAGKESREIFLGISEAATVLGLSAAQTGGALTAIEQIISKGKVSAEELRGQLGERLPGAFQIAARSIGVTTSELDDMLKKGELTADELLPKLARELRKTFGPQVAESANSAEAAINRLSTSIFNLKVAIAESGVLDAVANFANGLSVLISGDSGFGKEADEAGKRIEALAKQRQELITQIERLSKDQNPGPQRLALIESLETSLADLEARLEQAKKLQLSILGFGERVEKKRAEPVLARFEQINAELDKAFRESAEKEAKRIEEIREKYVREFETAEDEVARRLEEFSLVEHLFKPEDAERIRKAIRETLYDGLEEIEIKVKKKLPKATKEGMTQMEEYTKQAARNMQDALADFLFDPFDKGLKGMLKGFIDIMRRMLAEIAASEILSFIFGQSKPGNKGGLGGFLGGVFGGGGVPGQTPPILPRAAGGPVTAGMPYLVGESGPELFMPSQSGFITPNHKLEGGGVVLSITNHINGLDEARTAQMVQFSVEQGANLALQKIRDLQARGQF